MHASQRLVETLPTSSKWPRPFGGDSRLDERMPEIVKSSTMQDGGSAMSGAVSIDLVVRSKSEQQNRLGPLALHELEYDAQVVARAARPAPCERPAQLMSPQGRM